MPEAISDTGPVLHLEEIGRLQALAPVAPLVLPDLVVRELAARGVEPSLLDASGIAFRIEPVEAAEWRPVVDRLAPRIQPADAQVFVLARARRSLALTDDLALRQLLESHGLEVAGTVGVLVRAYKSGTIPRDDLTRSVEALIHDSTLRLSHAFRAYLRMLLSEIP